MLCIAGPALAQTALWGASAAAVCRDMTWGKLPKDGWLLGDVEIRNVIEAFAEDDAIFQAVRAHKLR